MTVRASTIPKLRDMAAVCLMEGPANGVVLPIAPTMKNVTFAGERYFRMTSWQVLEDGTVGACYLWDGWAAQRWPDIFGEEKVDA